MGFCEEQKSLKSEKTLNSHIPVYICMQLFQNVEVTKSVWKQSKAYENVVIAQADQLNADRVADWVTMASAVREGYKTHQYS